jgi:hypothetical protein
MIVYEIETTVRIEISVSAATHEEAKKLAGERWRSTENQLLAPLIGAGGVDVILQGNTTRRWFNEDAAEGDEDFMMQYDELTPQEQIESEKIERQVDEAVALEEASEEEEGLTL